MVFQQLKQDMEVDIDGMLNNYYGKNTKKSLYTSEIPIYKSSSFHIYNNNHFLLLRCYSKKFD